MEASARPLGRWMGVPARPALDERPKAELNDAREPWLEAACVWTPDVLAPDTAAATGADCGFARAAERWSLDSVVSTWRLKSENFFSCSA